MAGSWIPDVDSFYFRWTTSLGHQFGRSYSIYLDTFFFGLIFLGTICLHFSIRISSLTNQVRTLTQHMGILHSEKQSLEEQIGLNSLEQNTSKLKKL